MPSQNNSGQQHQKESALTLTATAALLPNRIIGYGGAHATSAGGANDAQGISETGAAIGEAVSVVTEYSYLVECSAAVALHDYIKPAADGSGRAAVCTLTDHCRRAMGATTAAGQLFEMQIVRHVHA